MATLPEHLTAAYEWIDSASEWGEALTTPAEYARESAENARDNDHPEISESDIADAIAWVRSQFDPRIIALAMHTDTDPNEIDEARWGEHTSDAIGADGRGHTLAGYDGEEVECGGFYLYRVN